MFKPNKHEEQQKKTQTKKKNIIIVYLMIRRKKLKKWHVEERKSRKKDKRRETKCVRIVGTAFCAERTKKNGQIHYNPVIILLSCCILNVFIIPLAYLTGIIIHCIRITQP